MMRRNVGTTNVSSKINTETQENAVARNKAVDEKPVAAARPTTRSVLADMKNQHQGLFKRSNPPGKTVENALLAKPEPRRPLRFGQAASNASLPAPKNAERKPAAALNKTSAVAALVQSTSNLATSTTTTLSNSSMNSTASSTTSFAIKTKLSFLQMAKPKLTRQNATSSLVPIDSSTNALQEETSTNGQITKLATSSEVAALHAELILSPVKEEKEDNYNGMEAETVGYSSTMMRDIDSEDKGNILLVPEYVNDIFDYLRFLERQQGIRENFLQGKDVTGRMRSILIDWLCQVHIRFHLLPETLYMTVALIDRFLQAVDVPKAKLQLVGISAMFIASKYEEMYAPEISDFVYITDKSCSKQDIRAMECLILRTLGFSIGRPLPIHFLRRYSKAADGDEISHNLAKYFLELSLVHYQLGHYPPSLITAAAVWLAMKLLNSDFQWTQTLVHYTTYGEEDFAVCLRRLCRVVVKTHNGEFKYQAIRNKFSTTKFLQISKHACLDMARINEYAK